MTEAQQTAGPAVDLIEHAASIITDKFRDPRTAPYHWAGALWEAGMLQPPGHAPTGNAPDADGELAAVKANRDKVAASLDAIWDALDLGVDDDPVATIRRVRAERDNAIQQRQALQNQVDSLAREVRRLQHAEGRASRHAIERDKDVAEADAFVAARDAEIARFNAREAALRLELHDARAERDTAREVARGNRRHVAVLTALIERVCQMTVDDEGKPKDPALIVYVGDLRQAIEAPVRIPGQPGDRVEDGGLMGTLVRCETCSGDGLLHKPDHLPPAAEPRESPEP